MRLRKGKVRTHTRSPKLVDPSDGDLAFWLRRSVRMLDVSQGSGFGFSIDGVEYVAEVVKAIRNRPQDGLELGGWSAGG